MIDENIKFKKYFLGSLDRQETEEIEQRIISEPELEEPLQAAENELMEDFIDGNLSPAETKLFQQNYLISSEREKQISHLALIKKYAVRQAQGVKKTEAYGVLNENYGQRLKKMFFTNLNPVNAFAALVIFGLVIGIGWILLSQNSGSTETASLQKEFAVLNEKDLSSLAEFQNLSNLSLISGSSRSAASEKNVLSKENLTANVLVRLALTFDADPTKLFRAEILRNQKVIFTKDRLPLYKNPNGQEFRLILPADALSKGDYQIKLADQTDTNLNLNYTFTVK